jgi:hypothetical protein
MSLVLDGSAGVTFPNSTVQVSSTAVIKQSSYTWNTRTVPSATSSGTAINIAWTVSFVKSSSTSKILIMGFIPAYGATVGNSQWLARINSGTYQFAGTGSYGNYTKPVVLNTLIDTSSLASGTYNIDIGWSTTTGGGGIPFSSFNPNSTDSASDINYQTVSNLIVMEVV